MKKDQISLARELAEYGIYAAGGDVGSDQQLDWGADCVEAAILLWKFTTNAPEKLCVCGDMWTAEELTLKAQELRDKAQKLRD